MTWVLGCLRHLLKIQHHLFLQRLKRSNLKKGDKETINELEEIIQDLISDKNELLQISQAYQQELMAQKISDEEIEYIITELIPKLQAFIRATGGNSNEIVQILSPLISKETLVILQLLGFNFRKAIGEPLTVLVEKSILSKLPLDQNTQTAIYLEQLRLQTSQSDNQ